MLRSGRELRDAGIALSADQLLERKVYTYFSGLSEVDVDECLLYGRDIYDEARQFYDQFFETALSYLQQRSRSVVVLPNIKVIRSRDKWGRSCLILTREMLGRHFLNRKSSGLASIDLYEGVNIDALCLFIAFYEVGSSGIPDPSPQTLSNHIEALNIAHNLRQDEYIRVAGKVVGAFIKQHSVAEMTDPLSNPYNDEARALYLMGHAASSARASHDKAIAFVKHLFDNRISSTTAENAFGDDFRRIISTLVQQVKNMNDADMRKEVYKFYLMRYIEPSSYVGGVLYKEGFHNTGMLADAVTQLKMPAADFVAYIHGLGLDDIEFFGLYDHLQEVESKGEDGTVKSRLGRVFEQYQGAVPTDPKFFGSIRIRMRDKAKTLAAAAAKEMAAAGKAQRSPSPERHSKYEKKEYARSVNDNDDDDDDD